MLFFLNSDEKGDYREKKKFDWGIDYCSIVWKLFGGIQTAIIRVAAAAAGSPVDITVNHATECTAIIDDKLSLKIPYLSIPGGSVMYSVDFDYVTNPAYPTQYIFKLKNHAVVTNRKSSCSVSTLTGFPGMYHIHIYELWLPNVITPMWIDMQSDPALSTDRSIYFVVTNYGVVSN